MPEKENIMEITIETERLMYCVGLILGEYVLVLLAVVADLISGVRYGIRLDRERIRIIL